MSPQELIQTYASKQKALNSARFFKTGVGQYGEGDIFLGLTVPEVRVVAKEFADLSIPEITKLLQSKFHEHRLTALMIMDNQFKKGDSDHKKVIYELYLSNTKYVNNWDLVDSSAEFIVGPYLGDNYLPVLSKLAISQSMWERRIAMLSCFYFIKLGNPGPAFKIIEFLKNDKEDLIQKAVGWMLREIGKRCGRDVLLGWLLKDDQYTKLPRTALRYSIEHFKPEERKAFLAGTFTA